MRDRAASRAPARSGGRAGRGALPGPARARSLTLAAASLIAAALAALSACSAPADGERTLTVLAAASLAAPFGEIADTLRARRGISARLAFAGSHQIALQVEQGARADLVAVADPAWTKRLEDHGFLAGPPLAFATNTLVLAIPAANPGRIASPADLARPGVKLVMGAAEVPVGRYAREVVARLASIPGAPRDFERRVLANVVSEEQDVTAVAAKVRLGEADAAFLYRSDLAPDLTAIPIPDSLGARARYEAAPLRSAPNPGAARVFLEILASPEGQSLLRRHGFGPRPE